MRTRKALTIGLAIAALAIHVAAAAQDEPKRPRLRRQVILLRAELAQLATQVSYATRAIADQPQPGFPAGSLCADPCATDSDGDGLGDCEDYCPCDPNTADGDGDAVPDCADPCPDDATDACIDPCNMDSDGDGTNDCEDVCPWDPAPVTDADEDNIPDCQDFCPGDPDNICFEPCRVDQDGDGVGDCDDECPWSGIPGTTDPNMPDCLPPPVGGFHR